MKTLLFILFFLTILTSCADRINKAAREVKYSAYEKVGYEKRDIFRRELSNVKEEQQETGEAFKDALTKLKEVYHFDGGNLEKEYSRLKASYEDARDEAGELKSRITQMETVAGDLFSEWSSESDSMKDPSLKKASKAKLSETKQKYATLDKQLKKSEEQMETILSKLQDQVTFLKHNLNAEAISGLKVESGKIQQDIEHLIREVEASSKQADALIKSI